MFSAVRLVADRHHLRAELPEHLRRDLVGGAIGACRPRRAEPVQRQFLRHGSLCELDVAVTARHRRVSRLPISAESPAGGQSCVDQLLDLELHVVRQLEAVRTEKLDAVVLEGIVRSRDHHPDIRPQGTRQHGDRRRRHRPEHEHIHAGGGEARDQRVLQHVAGQPRVLADHDPVAMIAAPEDRPDRHADPHGDIRRHVGQCSTCPRIPSVPK